MIMFSWTTKLLRIVFKFDDKLLVFVKPVVGLLVSNLVGVVFISFLLVKRELSLLAVSLI